METGRILRRVIGVATATLVFAAPAGASAEVLFNNIDETSPRSINSQNFNPANDAFDAMAADDFVVPAGETWTITGALVRGTQDGTTPTTSAEVRFFADAGGAPGAEIPTGAATATDYPRMNLTFAGPTLSAGTYWFGVSANLDPGTSAPFSQWYWSENSEQFGSNSVYRNPGNGFTTGCTSFTTKSSCVFTGPGGGAHTAPDQSFNLSGTRTLPPSQPPAGEDPACTAAKAALETAKAKLKTAKEKAKKARGKAKDKAAAKVKKAKERVKKAQAAVTEACS
ncbi:MAG: hypothetical protein U0R24_02675 [Solirubrobacterales bacterium]